MSSFLMTSSALHSWNRVHSNRFAVLKTGKILNGANRKVIANNLSESENLNEL